jgi:hypothetical protein
MLYYTIVSYYVCTLSNFPCDRIHMSLQSQASERNLLYRIQPNTTNSWRKDRVIYLLLDQRTRVPCLHAHPSLERNHCENLVLIAQWLPRPVIRVVAIWPPGAITHCTFHYAVEETSFILNLDSGLTHSMPAHSSRSIDTLFSPRVVLCLKQVFYPNTSTNTKKKITWLTDLPVTKNNASLLPLHQLKAAWIWQASCGHSLRDGRGIPVKLCIQLMELRTYCQVRNKWVYWCTYLVFYCKLQVQFPFGGSVTATATTIKQKPSAPTQ